MNVKIHPQNRAFCSLEGIINSRNRTYSDAELKDWLNRGWNPFIRQSDNASRTGMELLVLDSRYYWIKEHANILKPLAEIVFPKGDNGKLQGGSFLTYYTAQSYNPLGLELLLDMGFDPNALHGIQKAPLLFSASRVGAEILLKHGANAESLSPAGMTWWESWMRRAIYNDIKMKDLDWVAKLCDPIESAKRDQLREAPSAIASNLFIHSAAGVAKRLLQAGYGLGALGIRTDQNLHEAFNRIVNDPVESADLLTALGEMSGWSNLFRVGLLSANELQNSSESSQAYGPSPIVSALSSGKIRLLNVLERKGLFNHIKSIDLLDLLLMKKPGNLAIPSWMMAEQPTYLALGWLTQNTPRNELHAFIPYLKEAVKESGSITRPWTIALVRSMVLSISGSDSLSEIYENGKKWRAGALKDKQTYEEFIVECEKIVVRAAMANKKSQPKIKSKTARL